MENIGYVIIGLCLVFGWIHYASLVKEIKQVSRHEHSEVEATEHLDMNIAICTWMLMWFGLGVVLVISGVLTR